MAGTRNNSCERNPMYGRKHSEETKRKIAESRKKYTKEKSFKWKGGRRINHNGYVEIFMPEHHRARGNGYVFEHILVAEKKIGRNLSPDETVHHIDHNKKNNTPENMEILTRSEHSRLHSATKERTGKYISCIVCGTNFYRKPYAMKRYNCKFCSRKCQGKYTMEVRYGRA